MSDILNSDNSGLSEDNDRIIQTDLRNEMSRSYLEYAMSVIAVSYTHLTLPTKVRV